jgi:DNA-binding beta-propeller fold protein YncE
MTWINEGAPSNLANIRFPNDAARKKIYVAMQSRDVVAVFDAESRQVMRYVKVGANDNVIELPHQIRISPDGQYWYVLFLNGQIIQRYRTFDDSFVGQANIGPGNWNTMAITPNGKHLFAADFSPFPAGKIVHVNLETMTMNSSFDNLFSPHGTYFMHTQNVLYVTAQYGNFIYKFNFGTDTSYVNINNPGVVLLQTGVPFNPNSSIDAHEIIFTPDESKYFVTCQKSNEVRIFSASDVLLDSISVGSFPQEMAVSAARNLLFVTCQEDSVSASVQPGEKGSVFVYNYASNAPVNISVGSSAGFTRVYQPHGIAVDDASGKVYVASLNYSTSGPAPHHSTGGIERNGFVSLIDMNTMEYVTFPDGFGFPYMYKCEVQPFPYSVMGK